MLPGYPHQWPPPPHNALSFSLGSLAPPAPPHAVISSPSSLPPQHNTVCPCPSAHHPASRAAIHCSPKNSPWAWRQQGKSLCLGSRRKERGTAMERVGDGKSDFPPFPGLGPGWQLRVVAMVTATAGSPLRTEECLLCLSSPL